MERLKGDGFGTFCIEVWVSASETKTLSSMHQLKQEDIEVCDKLPHNGELHIVYGLQCESLKRELMLALISKLSVEKDIIKRASTDSNFKAELKQDLLNKSIAQIISLYETFGARLSDDLVESFINKHR